MEVFVSFLIFANLLSSQRIAHNLDSFTDLPKQDQNALLKVDFSIYTSIHFCDLITMNYYANSFFAQENADLLVSLRGAIFFDSKKKGVDQVLISMGIGEWPRFLSHGAI